MSIASFRSVCGPPVARLPVELLDEIFLHSLCGDPSHSTLDGRVRQSCVVSQVCRLWRTVALADSRLWNKISLSRWQNMERFPWIKELLNRSQKSTLSLRLWIGTGWDDQWDDMMEPVLLRLIPRLRELRVRMDYILLRRAPKLIENFSLKYFPVLESLDIAPFNVCKNPGRLRGFDFWFDGDMPRLRRVRYELNHDYIAFSRLSNLTYFKLTSISHYGNPGLSADRCLELLRSMPLLEELHLLSDLDNTGSDSDTNSDNSDDHRIIFSRLKRFQMNGDCSDCAALLQSISIPPGCKIQVICLESDCDEVHMVVRQAMLRLVRESALDMLHKSLEINIRTDTISIVADSLYSTPRSLHESEAPPFQFITKVRVPEEEESDPEDADPPANGPTLDSIHYILLMLIIRTIHSMKLTQASQITLDVDADLYIEKVASPILVSLLRISKSAKRLCLSGKQNAFMTPVLGHMMYGTGKIFEEVLFTDLGASDASWNPVIMLQHSFNPNNWPLSIGPILPDIEFQNLKTVSFLHTDFNVTSANGMRLLSYVVNWREKQVGVVDNLLWPIYARNLSLQKYGWLAADKPLIGDDITMAHMMHYYLKPGSKGIVSARAADRLDNT